MKLLVADDEKWIRKGIISKLEELNFEFDWIGEAADGNEALNMIKKESPHIVITDIRMPDMDGLGLIEAVKALDLKTKFIIISGYSEFDYAMQAVNLGACGYLLKPMSDEALREKLQKVINDLKNEGQISSIKSNSDKLKSDNNFLLIEKLINEILRMPNNSQDLFEERLREYNFLNDKSFILSLIRIDKRSFYKGGFSNKDISLVKYSFVNVLEDITEELKIDRHKILVLSNFENIDEFFVLMFDQDQRLLKSSCVSLMNKLHAYINTHLDIELSISISCVQSEISAQMYLQCKEIFNLRFVHGTNRIFKYETQNENIMIPATEHKIKLLKSCISADDLKNVEIILNDIFSAEGLKKLSGVNIGLLYMNVVNAIIDSVEKSEALQPFLLPAYDMLDQLNECSQIVSYLYNHIVQALGDRLYKNMDCSDIIEKAKDYIDKNYSENITVKSLGEEFNINSNYFSTLFKQRTGQNFTKYFNEVRIKKACELLVNTKVNIIEISNIVGYPDGKYFYRVFKKVTGRTPLEYRMEAQR